MIYSSPEFWVAVAFVGAVGLVFKRVVIAVNTILDARTEKIRSRLSEARQLREEAQELLAEYQRKQRDVIQKTEDIISRAKAEVNKQKELILSELTEITRRKEAQALARIALSETQALTEIRNIVVDIALEAAEELIDRNITQEQAMLLIDQIIKELPNSFKEDVRNKS